MHIPDQDPTTTSINHLIAVDTHILYPSYNSQLVLILLEMSLGLRFCASREGRTGGGGVISLLLSTNGLRKQHSGHVGPPFLAMKHVYGWPLANRDYWKFVKMGMVWVMNRHRMTAMAHVKLEASKHMWSRNMVHLTHCTQNEVRNITKRSRHFSIFTGIDMLPGVRHCNNKYKKKA